MVTPTLARHKLVNEIKVSVLISFGVGTFLVEHRNLKS